MAFFSAQWRSVDWWLRALGRLLVASLLWWILTEGAEGSWYLGAPAVVLATAASLRWSGTSHYRVRLLGLLRFSTRFLASSLAAGFDVARRALAPSLPLDPALVSVRTQLPPGPPRWLLATTLSLVPGSLTVTASGDRLLLHSLDRALDIEAEVRGLERAIAALFGCSLERDR